MATGRGTGLGTFPLPTVVRRLRRRQRLLKGAGQNLVDQGEGHPGVGRTRTVNGTPSGVGSQDFRSGRPMLSREQIACGNDLTQRE